MRTMAGIAILLLVAGSASSLPQTPTREAKTERAYRTAFSKGPLALRAFLVGFPKGANLHMHLSGAVYAETFIRDAGEDGLCVNTAALSFAKDDHGEMVKEPCALPLIAAAKIPGTQGLYDRLVDSFSMRNFVAAEGVSGHDHFFATFGKFGGIGESHMGEWVDEVASRAAAQNLQYLEIIRGLPANHAIQTAKEIAWDGQLAKLREALLAKGLRDDVEEDRRELRAAEASRRKLEHCGSAEAAPACNVEVRYLYSVSRGAAPEVVFAQALLGFEATEATIEGHDDTLVGINFLQAEDGYLAMRDYTLQMKMVEYLHGLYPKVHITLHAGELAPGLVPPEGLRFHIRQAVETAGAERIGHGVDVMYENDAAGLLKKMAARHVMVEISLSSNEGILGVRGDEHPFPLYREAHVPVALSTDDEGVSRIDITNEYVRAALEFGLSYGELKDLARTGMEHSFLPGTSLWAVQDAHTTPAAACKAEPLGSAKPAEVCAAFLAGSEKAAAQWELERRLRVFEETVK